MPGGVDEHERTVLERDRQVDRVAGRAGDLGDDHALVPSEAIDSEDLPTLGRPISARRIGVVGVVLGARPPAQQLDDPVEQIAGAQSLRGRDRDRVAEPQRVELGGERQVADAVDLVGGDEHGQRPRRSRSAISWSPGRSPARASTTSRPRRRPRAPRAPGPGSDAASVSLVLEVDAAGVDQRQRAAVPLGPSSLRSRVIPARSCTTASRDSREAVHQRRLTDVRIADDRDFHGPVTLGGPLMQVTCSCTGYL